MLQAAAAIEAVRATMRFNGRRVPKREKPHLADTDSQEVLGLSVSSGPWAEWGLSVREVSSLEAETREGCQWCRRHWVEHHQCVVGSSSVEHLSLETSRLQSRGLAGSGSDCM